MSLKRLIMGAAAAGAFFAVASTAGAATVSVGTFPPAAGYFYLTSGTPISPSITADFGDTITTPSTTFDETFDFTIPQNGVGSGSLSTSFSSAKSQLTITDVLINGVSYFSDVTSSGSGQGLSVGGIKILANVLNTIEVKGFTSSQNTGATFSGTATFAAVPEPAGWALMIGGLAFVGAAMRRRRATAFA